ncbi:hypothetical protein K5I29_04105 [Flavobacterium agricola]|uniref:Uncharacterized protein n=1 Tax=Flavobacterium agricola TaxID=2870839 RepID=A0ABY6M0K7_9FLAO|nr:hypothetical protein [Flavobacterium agricola]UYW02092.1 hypothetical protein K5I29_04105 [Flavobacterium agricola]
MKNAEIEKYAIEFTEWLILNCDLKSHGVFAYRGDEMTQKELVKIFNKTRK